MPVLAYKVDVLFDPEDAYDGDPAALGRSYVLNNARNERGFEYFDAVDLGRKGFTHGPHVLALHWVEGGEDVFRESVGPAIPRNLRQITSINAQPRIDAYAKANKVSDSGQLQELADGVAQILMEEIEDITPVRYSGGLKGGYYISSYGGGDVSVYDVNGGPYEE